ncbi:hypothetical protein LCGC14_0460780 [marine sediment metagenome]|uniref:Uncharacterized protein n=1 Tax=marine sediment metagenome TaxID=412755 RepID=A0A0F9V1V4_9ZZZZ|nr:hypothetical protein [bacterium]
MKEETKILCRLFKALNKARKILGEENWHEIRRRLAEGSLAKNMLFVSISLRREERDFMEGQKKIISDLQKRNS